MSALMTKKTDRSRPTHPHGLPSAQHGAHAIHMGEVTHQVSLALHVALRRVWIIFIATAVLTLVSLALGCDNAAVAFGSASVAAIGAKLGIGRP